MIRSLIAQLKILKLYLKIYFFKLVCYYVSLLGKDLSSLCHSFRLVQYQVSLLYTRPSRSSSFLVCLIVAGRTPASTSPDSVGLSVYDRRIQPSPTSDWPNFLNNKCQNTKQTPWLYSKYTNQNRMDISKLVLLTFVYITTITVVAASYIYPLCTKR